MCGLVSTPTTPSSLPPLPHCPSSQPLLSLPLPPPFSSQGADRYILDLRANPGGLVSAGIDVASLFLDGEQPVFNIQVRACVCVCVSLDV